MLLPQGWRHIRHDSLHSASAYKHTLPSVTTPSLNLQERQLTHVMLYGCPADVWRPQSIIPWTLGSCPKVQNKIPNPDSLLPFDLNTAFSAFCLPLWVFRLFFTLSPSTLHSSSSLVKSHSQMCLIVVHSLLPLHLYFLLSFPPPFPLFFPSLSSSLPICLVDVSVSSLYYHIRKRWPRSKWPEHISKVKKIQQGWV